MTSGDVRSADPAASRYAWTSLLGAALLLTATSTAAWASPANTESGSMQALRVETASVSDDDDDDNEIETATVTAALEVGTSTGPRYTAELGDGQLAALWKDDRAALGSISMGSNDFGRVVNGVPFPEDPRWVVVDPPNTYGTRESVAYLRDVLEAMLALHPDAPPVRVNHMSAPEGGYLRPHRSHQLGRDVDVGLYYGEGRAVDLALNWAFLRLVLTRTDVEVVLLDRRLIRAVRAYAASIGEDPAWLEAVFGGRALVQHAPRHRDHFHLRFYNPRAQELGWRVQPLLAHDEKVPQVMRHRIRSGDSLGKIAQRYGVTITAIKRLNRMNSNFIRAGRSLAVPVRGLSCVRCPAMARVAVPPRRLPPDMVQVDEMLAGQVSSPLVNGVQASAPTVGADVIPASAVPASAVPDAAQPPADVAPPVTDAPAVRPAIDAPSDSTRRGLWPPLS